MKSYIWRLESNNKSIGKYTEKILWNIWNFKILKMDLNKKKKVCIMLYKDILCRFKNFTQNLITTKKVFYINSFLRIYSNNGLLNNRIFLCI